MKWLRLLLAGAVLLGLTAVSNADYVLIRCVVGGKKTDPNASGFGGPGDPGRPGGPGAPAPPPGIPGGPPRGGPPSGPGGPGSPDEGGGLPTISGGQVVDIDTAAFVAQGIVQVKWLQPTLAYRARV